MTATITQAIETAATRLTAAGFDVTTRDYTPAGDIPSREFTVRRGIHVVRVSPINRGELVFVSMILDYGDYGTSFHDAAYLKSAAGIVRRVTKFLA